MNEIIDYYDNLAELYESDRFENSYGKFIDSQERKILDELLTNKNEIVLDLACGTGRLLNYATHGSDASQNMIKQAVLKYPNKTILLNDAEKTSFEDSSIDTIICFHFFMHLNQSKIDKILLECKRILKPNGRLIFDIPSKKRRQLLNYKAKNWHGAFSMSFEEISKNNDFKIGKKFGILLTPIHRLPSKVRPFFNPIDRMLTASFLKVYSSYLVLEFIKK